MLVSIENTKNKKSKTEEAQKNIHYELLNKLEHALEKEKCYLDASLTLTLLAKKLKTNREYLSRAINQVYGKTYIDLINGYRVNAAIVLLENISNGTIKHWTMLKVAKASGFKSTSTFNPAFKKIMGVTPKECKGKIKSKKL